MDLAKLKQELKKDLNLSKSSEDLQKLKVKYLGKKGKITDLSKTLGKLDQKDRPIVGKKINKIKIVEAKKINDNTISNLSNLECLIIENFNKNINENLLYSILNHSKQLENFVLINSVKPLNQIEFELKDLKSRISSFIFIGIDLPTDELLQVIISKSFSDKQINLNPKISDYIIKNVERSYDKIFKFLKDIDDLSLSSGKSININLIKKVLVK